MKVENTITLNEKELKAFEGHYWEPKDLFSRKIRVQGGSLQYDRRNGSVTELAPIAQNKFVMLETPSHVTVEFSKKDGKNRMIVVQDGDVVAELDAYTPVDPKEVDYKPYLGNYFSEELSTQYSIVEKEDKLVATHPRHSDLPLTLIKPDVFQAGRTTLEFTRNGSNAVDGLRAYTGRVKRLRFTKVH